MADEHNNGFDLDAFFDDFSPNGEPESDLLQEFDVQPQPEVRSRPKRRPRRQPEPEPEPEVRSRPKRRPRRQPEPEPESQLRPEPEPEPEPRPEPEPEPESGRGPLWTDPESGELPKTATRREDRTDEPAATPRQPRQPRRRPRKEADSDNAPDALKGKLPDQGKGKVKPDRVASKRPTGFGAYVATESKRSLERKLNIKRHDDAFESLPIDASGHEIRGGGIAQAQQPLKILLLAGIVVVGLIVSIFFLVSMITTMLDGSSGRHQFTTTAALSRKLIDANTPLLINYLAAGPSKAPAAIAKDLSLKTFKNSAYTNDTIDSTAKGFQVIGADSSHTADDFKPFFTSGYNAYTPDLMEQLFNGSWVLDLNNGDLGTIYKLKYVNLASTSIDEEITQLRVLEALDKTGVKVVADGKDAYGNRVVEGTKTIKKVKYYWRIGACDFDEVYRQSVPDTAVYVTCTVATYEFYKGDVITNNS